MAGQSFCAAEEVLGDGSGGKMVKNWMLAIAAIVAIIVTVSLLAWYASPAQVTNARPTALYEIVAANGSVYNFGAPGTYGSLAQSAASKPIAAIAVTPDGGGYWFVGAGGTIYPFGDARTYGSMSTNLLDDPIVGIAATADGKGYWLASSDGSVFSFGDARFHGSMDGKALDDPIVGIAATADGKGYWLVASDGGVFSFGDAAFHGSMGGRPLNEPVVGIAATSSSKGYWLVASDGGVFSFGDAAFHGSMGGKPLNKPMVGIAATPGGNGYWLVASDGGVFSFNAPFYGSMGGKPIGAAVVGIASARAPTHVPPPPPPTTVAPSINSFVASTTLPSGGGSSALQWSTSNAAMCTVSSSPAISGSNVTVPCSDNGISVVVPPDSTKKPIIYTFTLQASGAAQPDATASASTTVHAAAPSIAWFRAPATVGWSGAIAGLQWKTSDATSCTVSVIPAISGLPATVPCSKGLQSVKVDANTSSKAVDYTFELDAKAATAPDATATAETILQASPKMLITVSPNPLVETGAGDVQAVVQISTTERLAGALVNISSTQLDALCKGGVTFTSIAPGVTAPASSDPIQATLDGDGNADVMVNGYECAAGNSLIEADLAATPFYTALTTLDILPPKKITPGVTGYPGNEIITGNTTASGQSDVYAVFYVATSSVYAEQFVEIQANELVDRCGQGSDWVSNQGASATTGTVTGSSATWTAQLDDNGNAVFEFFGASCASGPSTVLANIEAGLHHIYSTFYKVLSPRAVIP